MVENFIIASYEVTIEAGERGLSLPAYKGSTLRGGFGSAFRRISCSLRDADCRACLLGANCPYAYIFETAPPPGAEVLRNFESVPRPFVLEPPLETKREYAPGEKLAFNLVLIGKAISFLPYFIVAFRELGEMGIGRQRKKFRLAEIRAVNPESGKSEAVYHAGDRLVRNVDLSLQYDAGYLEKGNLQKESLQEGALPKGGLYPTVVNQVSGKKGTILNKDLKESHSNSTNTCEDDGALQPVDTERGKEHRPQDRFHAPEVGCGEQGILLPSGYAPRAGKESGAGTNTRRVSLEYRTMTRIKFEQNFARRLEFHILIRSLLRRLSSLAYFHHGWELDLDFTGLIEHAAAVRLIKDSTRWVDWERYSSRQDSKMNLGGVMGRAVYKGDLDKFIPILRLGELVHVGKGAVFGMGKYRMEKYY